MQKQLFYIHGGDAYLTHEAFLEDLQNRTLRDPYGEGGVRWTDTLRPKLGERYEIFTPKMPCKENAKYEEWKVWFERHIPYLGERVTVLGWSLGGIFFAKYLSENEVPFTIERLYLLAAPFNSEDLCDVACGDFVLDPELIAKLPEKVGQIVLMHSKDDFVVPYEHGLVYQALLLTAELVTFEDKNHFLIEEFPELIERLQA